MHDPGVGFITLTKVVVSPDLQLARVYYTTMGDEKAQRETAKALGPRDAVPAAPDRPARAPPARAGAEFFYDKSVAQHDRIEQILQD